MLITIRIFMIATLISLSCFIPTNLFCMLGQKRNIINIPIDEFDDQKKLTFVHDTEKEEFLVVLYEKDSPSPTIVSTHSSFIAIPFDDAKTFAIQITELNVEENLQNPMYNIFLLLNGLYKYTQKTSNHSCIALSTQTLDDTTQLYLMKQGFDCHYADGQKYMIKKIRNILN